MADSDFVPDDDVAEATVTVGDVTPDDTSAIYVEDDDDPNSIWTDYQVINRFESDRHIYMLPITSPGGFQNNSVAFCQLAARTLLWISDWTAERWGKAPKIPDPNPSDDPNLVLLDTHYEPTMVLLGADGATTVYRISGTYVYGFKNPDNVGSLYYGRPPWMDNVIDRTVRTESYTPGIIRNQDGVGGSNTSTII